MVKNPPANVGDMGLIPGLGRSHTPWSHQAHMPQLLSPHATRETTAMRSLSIVTRESLHVATKTQHSQKQINKKIFFKKIFF